MKMMLAEICAEIKNYFCTKKVIGRFDIADRGSIFVMSGDEGAVMELPDNQYFRVIGSDFNDDVYKVDGQWCVPALKEEEFKGAVWLMSPPKDFLRLVDEIEAWNAKYGAIDSPAQSPYSSESFGGYSYSKGSTDGAAVTWREVFRGRLNKWRKIL
jgi:hypothetical protein